MKQRALNNPELQVRSRHVRRRLFFVVSFWFLGVVILFSSCWHHRKQGNFSSPSSHLVRYRLNSSCFSLAPALGFRNSPVNLIEFFNPLNARSRQLIKMRKILFQKFAGRLRWTFCFNPNIGKDQGYLLSMALLLATKYLKFQEYLKEITNFSQRLTFQNLVKLAKKVGINPEKFELELQYYSIKNVIDQHMRLAYRLGLNGRSALFINGLLLLPPYDLAQIVQIIEKEQARADLFLQRGVKLSHLSERLLEGARSLPQKEKYPYPIEKIRYRRIGLGYLEGIPVRGAGDDFVTILEYSDFTCKACRKAYLLMEDLLLRYGDALRFYFKIFPVGLHRESYRTAEVAAAAQSYGKFWPLYHLLFRKQEALFRGDLLELVVQAGIERRWIAGEIDRHSYKKRILQNRRDAQEMGITSVPTFFINGRQFIGVPSAQRLEKIIKIELWKAGSPRQDYP